MKKKETEKQKWLLSSAEIEQLGLKILQETMNTRHIEIINNKAKHIGIWEIIHSLEPSTQYTVEIFGTVPSDTCHIDFYGIKTSEDYKAVIKLIQSLSQYI